MSSHNDFRSRQIQFGLLPIEKEMIKILNFIKSNFIFKIFRNIPIPFIIIFCFLNGQNELNGKWYKDRTNWKIYLNINTSNEGQTLDQYIKVGDKQNLIYSKKIYKQWLGMPFTLTEYEGESYKTKLKFIDDKTILYGNDIYKKYDLPKNFLKGN
jgi:hypothetical protein